MLNNFSWCYFAVLSKENGLYLNQGLFDLKKSKLFLKLVSSHAELDSKLWKRNSKILPRKNILFPRPHILKYAPFE